MASSANAVRMAPASGGLFRRSAWSRGLTRIRGVWGASPPVTLLLTEGAAAAALAGAVVVAVLKDPGVHRGALGLTYLALLALIAVWDLRTRRAPNRIVFPALAFAILASLTLGWNDAVEAILGGLAALGLMILIALAGRGAMGMGDVKVGALCGVVVGLHGVLFMVAATFVIGLVVAVPLVLLGVRKRQDSIAFTPFLALGTALSVVLGRLYLWG